MIIGEANMVLNNVPMLIVRRCYSATGGTCSDWWQREIVDPEDISAKARTDPPAKIIARKPRKLIITRTFDTL